MKVIKYMAFLYLSRTRFHSKGFKALLVIPLKNWICPVRW